MASTSPPFSRPPTPFNTAGPSKTAATATQEWNAGSVIALGTGLSIVGATLEASFPTAEWNAGSVTAVGAGLAINSDTLNVTFTEEWTAGSVTALGSGLAINSDTLDVTFPAQEWTAGSVTALGTGLAINSDTLDVTFPASEWAAGTVTALGAGLGIASDILNVVLSGYIGGLNLTVATTSTLTAALGSAMASNNAAMMTLASGLTKSTSGAWVAGNNQDGMGAGLTIANNTWYHVFLIVNGSNTDIYFDTSVTAANAPAGTSLTRRIGSFLTNGSAQIISFFQNGNRFDWAVPINNVVGTVGSAAGQTATATVPSGVIVEAIMTGNLGDPSGNGLLYVSSLAQTDEAPATAFLTAEAAPLGTTISWAARIITNASQQLRYRVSSTTASLILNTNGWIDRRGSE
jgi:hypothetical protein